MARAASASAAPGAARASRSEGFDGLRRQFERRRKAKCAELERAMEQVDIEAFTRLDEGGRSGLPDFELWGALPPTTSARIADVGAVAAMGRSEKQAAQELIERQEQAAEEERNAKLQHRRPPAGRSAPPAPPPRSAPTPRRPGAGAGPPTTPRAATAGGQAFRRPRTGRLQDDSSTADDNGPMSRGWEGNLIEFYRQAEFEHDAARTAEAHYVQQVEQEQQRRKVQYTNFEQKHRQREAAIIAESSRRRRRAEFDNEKALLEEKLQMAQTERRARLEEKKEAARAAKEQVADRKKTAEVFKDFTVKQGMLDKTCHKVDVSKLRSNATTTLRWKVQQHRQESVVRSDQIETKKALHRAYQVARDAEDKSRLTFLMKQKQAREDDIKGARHQKIQAQRALDAFVREAREELTSFEDDITASPDFETYQRSLAAFRELAEDVRAQGLKMKAETDREQAATQSDEGGPPLFPNETLVPLEQRVKMAFDQAKAQPGDDFDEDRGSEMFMGDESVDEQQPTTAQSAGRFGASVHSGSNSFLPEEPERGPPLGFGETHGSGWASPSDDGEPRMPTLPLMAATVPPLPLRAAVLPVVAAHRDSAVAPLTYRSMRPSVAADTAAPPPPRSARQSYLVAREGALADERSLAALRMLRRTGPVAR